MLEMKGNKTYKLGELIELCDERNTDGKYTLDDVRGVNNLKELMPTKADMNGRDISKFSVVNPADFVFNHRTSRNGSKFSIAYNDGTKPIICTEDYVVFKIKKNCENTLIKEWLYMFFNRPEFDRFVITNSWGSSTEFYNWEDLCSITITLPPLAVQQKYVAVYRSMQQNLAAYESGLDDLKLTCDGLVDRLKVKGESLGERLQVRGVRLGELINESDERNTDGKITFVNGVNKDKMFMPTVAAGEDLTKYKVVRRNQFACNLMHIGRDISIPVALQTSETPIIVSPAYIVFQVDSKDAIPDYIQLWLSREETGRYAWFMCDSSVRSGMEKTRFFDITIPLPSMEIQRDVVNIYKCYLERRRIAEKLKEQIKNICPILIRGSLEELKC